jgi:hypothetical protein
MKGFKKIILLFAMLMGLGSCVSVKPYQKAYLNDDDMKLAPGKSEGVESSFQAYREGASGAESGKIGGGCGCN